MSRSISVGAFITYLSNTCLDDEVRKEFLKQAQEAYISCGAKLQDKMPVNNEVLIHCTALDPAKQGKTTTLQYLQKLPTLVTNVGKGLEMESYKQECHWYVSLFSIP